MKAILLTLLSLISLSTLTYAKELGQTTAKEFQALIEAIDCSDKKWATANRVEDTDRAHYKPSHSISAHIKSNQILTDGYQKGGRQNYFLTVETYATEEQAKLRASEYLTDVWRKRLAKEEGFDYHMLSKQTVRCSSYAKANKVYLLTTHSSYSHLVSGSVQKAIIAYLN